MGLFSKNPVQVEAPMTPARTVNLTKDTTGKSAVDLTKVRNAPGGVDLAKRADKAGIALGKIGLNGIRAKVVVVLDHSGSMRGDYQNGNVQTLVERALGFALQVDTDGEVPVIPFDHGVRRIVNVNTGNYQGIVDSQIWASNQMGSTNLTEAMHAVLSMAKDTTEPMYVVVVTDGEPDSTTTATKVICELSRYPVFIKFLAIRPVTYLTTLDKLPDTARLLDNVNSQPDADDEDPIDLLTCSDLQFAVAMAQEWDEWFVKAKNAGVLT